MSVGEASRAILEQAINQYLSLDPNALNAFASLHGRVICLDMTGLNTKLYLVPDPARLQLLGSFEGEPDCTLRGSPIALMNMRGSSQSADQLFAGNVEIIGDAEVGHKVGNILSSLDIDWEEQLSRLTGDVVAHEAGNLVRNVLAWGKRTRESLGLDLRDYLQEESRMVPTRYELDGFLADVDRLREDADRLEARIRRLSKAVSGGIGSAA